MGLIATNLAAMVIAQAVTMTEATVSIILQPEEVMEIVAAEAPTA